MYTNDNKYDTNISSSNMHKYVYVYPYVYIHIYITCICCWLKLKNGASCRGRLRDSVQMSWPTSKKVYKQWKFFLAWQTIPYRRNLLQIKTLVNCWKVRFSQLKLSRIVRNNCTQNEDFRGVKLSQIVTKLWKFAKEFIRERFPLYSFMHACILYQNHACIHTLTACQIYILGMVANVTGKALLAIKNAVIIFRAGKLV